MTDAPNWVAERAMCNLDRIFTELRDVVERDVEQANHHLSLGVYRVSTASSGTPRFGVRKDSPLASSTEVIRFVKESYSIQVKHGTRLIMEAYPSWNHQYDCCVLRVGEDEYRVWEFSRLVLEDEFFPA